MKNIKILALVAMLAASPMVAKAEQFPNVEMLTAPIAVKYWQTLPIEQKKAFVEVKHKEFLSLSAKEKDKRFMFAIELIDSVSPQMRAKFKAKLFEKLSLLPSQKIEKIQKLFKERWNSLTSTQQVERKYEARKLYASIAASEQVKFKQLLPEIYNTLMK